MCPQDIAGQAAPRGMVEALPPHTRAFAHAACAFSRNSVMVSVGCTQVTHTSEPGHMGRLSPHQPVITDRRHVICRTASKASWPSAWSRSLQLAPSRPKKSSWLLSPSPSAKSRSTPVSTSNPLAVYRGQAIRPVPTRGACPWPDGLTQSATQRKTGQTARCAIRPALPDSVSLDIHSFSGSSRTRANRAAGAGAVC